MESFTIDLVSNATAELVSDNTLNFFTVFFTGAIESGRSMGGCTFGNISPIKVPKCHRARIHVFWCKNFQNHLNFTIWNTVSTLTLPLRILLKPWTLPIKKDLITAKAVSELKCLEERKKLRFLLQMKDPVLHSLVDLGHIFGSNVGN